MFALLPLALALGAGCGRATATAIPRTLQGNLVRGPFVPPTAYEAFVRGELYLAQGRAREAVAHFELATTAPDEDAYLLSRLAEAELRAGDPAAARRTLARASELDGCSEGVWLTRGLLAEQASDPVGARKAYEQAQACAPRSNAGSHALAQLLAKSGALEAALDVLINERATPLDGSEQDLARSLAASDPATLAHALAGLGAARAPSTQATEYAVRLALRRDLPRLAERVAEARPGSLPAALEAELRLACGAREQLAALLARTDGDDLGGPDETARLALAAGDYERAELEATSALQAGRSDARLALRARARLAAGRLTDARADIAQVSEPALRSVLWREALRATGAPALARELAPKAQ